MQKSQRTLFPIQDEESWAFYKKQRDSFWFPSEIDLSDEASSLNLMNETEKNVLLHILAFFAGSDAVVNEKLALSLYEDAPTAEACMFYSMQMGIEAIHQETYNLLIDSMIIDKTVKNKLFDSVNTMPCIKAKAEWFDKESTGSHAKRLFVQAIVEGIMFSASFAYIYYIKQTSRFGGKFPGLCHSNDFIARDEGLHRDFSIMLYKRTSKLDENTAFKLIQEAVSLEHKFIHDAFNEKGMLGLNAKMLCDYVEFCADHLLKSANHNACFKMKNPLDFMERISLDSKKNFFEQRVAEYVVPPSLQRSELTFDADF